MKTFSLSTVDYQGRTYTKCTLLINEQVRRAEVQRPAGLGRRKQSTIVSFEYGPGSEVSVSEVTVKIQSITLVAEEAAVADEIGRVFNAPRQEVVRSDASAKLQETVADLLNQRAAAIDFLVRYKANPRRALFELDPPVGGKVDQPLDDYFGRAKEGLSRALERIGPAVAAYERVFGSAVTDNVFAFVYAVGKMQDAIVSNDGANDGLRLLTELGVEAVAEQDPVKLTTDVLRRSVSLLFVT